MPGYTAYLEQSSEPLKKIVHVIDDRIPHDGHSIGGFAYPSSDGLPLYHKVQALLDNFHLYDMHNVTIQIRHYEVAVYFDLPEEMTLCVGETKPIPVRMYPLNSSTRPMFQVSNDRVVVDGQGRMAGLKPGKAVVHVTASDNPILHYEIAVTVVA